MSRILTLLFSILFLGNIAVAREQKLSESITWTLTDSGQLLINGEGVMPDFKISDKTGWLHKKYNSKVREIIVGEGITAIGAFNFHSVNDGNSMTSLRKVVLPSSLRYIGVCAFYGTGVTEIQFREGLTEIATGAFERSYNLKSVTLPASLLSIGNGAFADCKALHTIDFCSSSATLGKDAFGGDSNLTQALNAANLKNAIGQLPIDVEEVVIEEEAPAGKPAAPDIFKTFYTGVILDYENNEVGECVIGFEKYGDGVLMSTEETYTNGRMSGMYFAFGHISNGKIMLEKDLYSQGYDEAFDKYYSEDIAMLIDMLRPCDPQTIEFNPTTGSMMWNERLYTPLPRE